jgi:hypothetical protein
MTILAPKVKTEIAEELLEQPAEERQVTIVYGSFINCYSVYVDPAIRLIDEDSGAEARLITAFHIGILPSNTLVSEITADPQLIFEGLPKSCRSFALYEPARPGLTPFRAPGIRRNDTDLYVLEIVT